MEKFFFSPHPSAAADVPLLFIPGWGFDSRLVRLYGLFPAHNLILPASFIDPQTFIDDLYTFLNGHGVNKIGIAGWSMGAQLALESALALADRTAFLELYAMRKIWPAREIDEIRTGIAAGLADYMTLFYRKCFLGYKKFYIQFVQSLQEDYLARIEQDTLLAGLLYLEKYSLPDRVPSEVNMRIIHGRKDVVAPVAEMVSFSGVSGEIIPHGGHLVFIDTCT